jgi:hypothetical protein
MEIQLSTSLSIVLVDYPDSKEVMVFKSMLGKLYKEVSKPGFRRVLSGTEESMLKTICEEILKQDNSEKDDTKKD